jgi:hypothetical protein
MLVVREEPVQLKEGDYALRVKSIDVPEAKRVQTGEAGTGSMVVRKGYGNDSSLMIATAPEGVGK